MTGIEKEIAAGEQALGNLDYDSAYSHFDKATKIEPKNSLAWFGKAEASLGIPKIDGEQIIIFYKKAKANAIS